jgi:hypothetical protein
MKRTTLFVPETLERELQLFARREGRPVASLVREALAEYLVSRRPHGTVPSFTGLFDSGRSHIAEKHEELLFKELSPHGEEPATVPKSVPAPKSRRRRLSTRRKISR